MKRMSFAALASIACLAPVVTTLAASMPDATFSLSGGAVATSIGYTWGDGTLQFEGKSHPFSISGLSVIDIGVESIDGRGDVFNLKTVDDFPGTYIAAGAGATLSGGGFVAAMENEKGVIVHLHSNTSGLRLNLSPGGVVIRLKEPVEVSQK